MDVKEEKLLGNKVFEHWYYVSKGRALLAMLRSVDVSQIVDIGAGSGVFAKMLIAAGKCQRAICVDPAYTSETDEWYRRGAIQYVRAIDKIAPSLVLFMDVLEHVDDDVALVRQYTENLPHPGKVLVTVPAYNFLWSGHDEFLGHRRRYTLAGLENRLKMANLKIIRSRYYFATLLPIAMLIRTVNRRRIKSGSAKAASMLREYPTVLNKILTRIQDFERLCILPFNRFAGLSIFCLAEKR